MPYEIELAELDTEISNGSLTIFTEDDPYIPVVEEDSLDVRKKVIREKRFIAIEMLTDSEMDIFSPVLRNSRIRSYRKKNKISKPSLYKWLKMFWRNGMTKNALLPDFEKCGGKGTERDSGVSQEIRSLIRKGYNRYHRKEGYTVKEAFNATIRHLFDKEIHGKKFSYNIFWEHGSKQYTAADRKRNRKGDRDYDNNIRALKGRSIDTLTGPCQLYQIDNTVRDIKVVASYDRLRCIGRPTFYAIRDVFTRAFVGIYITLDPPSYIAACHALQVSFSPRRAMLIDLGLSEKHIKWFNNFLPKEILADRAEFLGPKSDTIVNNLGISLGNTAAYSPWMKGDVEKMIDLVQERLRHNFLGKGQISKETNPRLATDSAQEATITLEELYAITWIVVNEFNTTHWIDDYPLTAEMVRDRVKKIPADIHRWAIANNLGKERTIDQRTLYLSTLESHPVTPNRKGFRLNKQDFVPIDTKAFDLFENAINETSVKRTELVFDPSNYRAIYWKRDGKFHKLRLRGENDAVYANEWEVLSANELYNEMKKEAQSDEQDVRNENDAEIEERTNDNKATGKRKTRNSRAAKAVDRAAEQYKRTEPAEPEQEPASLPDSTKQPVVTSPIQSHWDEFIDSINA